MARTLDVHDQTSVERALHEALLPAAFYGDVNRKRTTFTRNIIHGVPESPGSPTNAGHFGLDGTSRTLWPDPEGTQRLARLRSPIASSVAGAASLGWVNDDAQHIAGQISTLATVPVDASNDQRRLLATT